MGSTALLKVKVAVSNVVLVKVVGTLMLVAWMKGSTVSVVLPAAVCAVPP